MSEQEALSVQPTEPGTQAESLSESEAIRRELAAAIEAGNNLMVKDVRVAVCHDIERKLNVPYKNVTKQVSKVLRRAVQNAGESLVHTRTVGSATAEVEVPPPVQSEPEPQPEQQQPSAAPVQQQVPKFNTMEELMASKEFKTTRMQLDMIFLGIDQAYGFLGINMMQAKQDPQIKQMFDAQMDGIAAYCVEEGLQMPKWAALLVVATGLGGIYIPPLLHKLGIIDLSGKKKEDKAKKSAEPLAPTEPM